MDNKIGIMMEEEDEKLPVLFTCKNGKEVYLVGTFHNNNPIKLNNINNENSVIIELEPNDYYYYFIVDGKDVIDYTKPYHEHKGKLMNYINITPIKKSINTLIKEKSKVFDEQDYFPVDSNEKECILTLSYKSNSSVLNNLTKYKKNINKNFSDFSGNVESNIANNILSNNLFSSEAITTKSLKYNFFNLHKIIIVFKLGENYLVPMQIINSENKSLTLRSLKAETNIETKDYIDDIDIDSNEIIYQKLSEKSLCGVENLLILDEINELSILKNLSIRIDNNEGFCYINDIFIYYNNIDVKLDRIFSEVKYNFTEWIDLKTDLYKCLYLIKSNIYPSDVIVKESNYFQYTILNEIIKYKNIFLHYNISYHLGRLYEVYSHFKNSTLFLIKLSENNEYFFNISMFPIIDNRINVLQKGVRIDLSSKKEFSKIMMLLDFENSFIHKHIKFFKDLSIVFLEHYFDFIYSISKLLKDLNSLHFFRNIFYLLLFGYIIENLKEIYRTNKHCMIFESIRNNIEFCDINNLKRFSNMIYLLVYKWLIDILSFKLEGHTNILNEINLCILNNSSYIDYEINELIFNKIKFNDNKQYSITDFLKTNFMQNINLLNKSSEMKLIIYLENYFDIGLIYDYYRMSYLNLELSSRSSKSNKISYGKLILLANNIFTESFSLLESLENENLLIKQILEYTFENYENYFTNVDNVFKFFEKNKIIEYIKYNKNSHFAEFTYKRFFNKYLPLLQDIDLQYDSKKNYIEALNLFIQDLQLYDNFKENFEIQENIIKINFLSFKVLTDLIKNIKEEKTINIQKNYRKFINRKYFLIIKLNVLKIQSAWRKYYYGKITEYDYDKCFLYISRKYKYTDPVLIKIFQNLYNNLDLLSIQHDKLITELNKYKKENKSLKSQINKDSLNNSKPDSYRISNKSSIPSIPSSRNNSNCKARPYSTSRDTTLNNTIKSYKESQDKLGRKDIESKIDYKYKYIEMLDIHKDQEKMLNKISVLINSNKEIKDIFNKYGINI